MTSNRSQSDLQRSLLRRSMRYASASLLLGGTVLVSGCLDRPIGNSRPVTTNVVIQRQINNAINAIDLLLMIDNSSSMADKQKVLADAVPQLLTQLVQPSCVDANNVVTSTRVTLGGSCPAGTSPEFNPVNNIHIGIVTSSLGDHGGGALCTPGVNTSFTDASGNLIPEPADVDDESHLVGTLARYASTTAPRTNVTVDATGFLAWGNSTKPSMGPEDLTAAQGIFADMVTSTKEMGCGLEAQLEGWYRFLIDPVPPILPITRDDKSQAHRIGSDDDLLAQRAAFLRPDSLVAIVMLTDENDCSLRDTDVGWVATDTKTTITTGSTQCETNPNDPCCYSCTTDTPGGCSNGCTNGKVAAQDDSAYQANIRCWHQKRRFGYEFMYPTSRYVVGLTNPTLCPDQSFGDMDCSCAYANSIHASCNAGSRQMPNPLYGSVIGTGNDGKAVNSLSSGIPRTDNSVIFLAGIVGVPWQDIGYKDANGNLVYIPVTDPSWVGAPAAGGVAPITPAPATGIWTNIYGDDNNNIVPADVHMVESLEARPGITANDNIEHEWNTAYQDLEYACIFPLPQSKACACDSNKSDYSSCKYQNPNDCCDLNFSVDGRGTTQPTGGTPFNKPLCSGNTQVNAKGYPGLREIAVLHDYATQAPVTGNSIVASICPADVKTTSDKGGAGYGYNPAVAALVTRLKEKLKGSCLPRPLQVKSDGTVPCSVVEVVSMSDMSGCDAFCTDNLRVPVSSTDPMRQAVLESMKSTKLCDSSTTSPCSEMCLCELGQESDLKDPWQQTNDLTNCQNADEGTVDQLYPGYCYVDPDLLAADGVTHLAGTNTALVDNCPSTQRRILRFAGNDPTGVGPTGVHGVAVPLSGAMVYTACQGSSLSD